MDYDDDDYYDPDNDEEFTIDAVTDESPSAKSSHDLKKFFTVTALFTTAAVITIAAGRVSGILIRRALDLP